ncbi:MAG: hypothetical protein ACOYEH_06615 [Caldicoprobacterales bacterium]|jgi:hypothetical protein|nr:hypothetical protein [Clostridiales bacterium]
MIGLLKKEILYYEQSIPTGRWVKSDLIDDGIVKKYFVINLIVEKEWTR